MGLLLSIPAFVYGDVTGGHLHLIESLAVFNTGTSWDGLEALKNVFFDGDS